MTDGRLHEERRTAPITGGSSPAVRVSEDPHWQEERRRIEEQQLRESNDRNRQLRLDQLAIPRQYEGASLATFRFHGSSQTQERHGRVLQLARRYIAAWPDRHEQDSPFPFIAVFRGAPGSGKGHVAWSIARAVVAEHGGTARLVVLSDAIRDLREAWSRARGESSEQARLARYRNPDLLVIDEVSRHALYGEPSQHLYDLVAAREADLRPTILTTNETPADFARLVGPALESRTAGYGGLWNFGDEDYRLVRLANTAKVA